MNIHSRPDCHIVNIFYIFIPFQFLFNLFFCFSIIDEMYQVRTQNMCFIRILIFKIPIFSVFICSYRFYQCLTQCKFRCKVIWIIRGFCCNTALHHRATFYINQDSGCYAFDLRDIIRPLILFYDYLSACRVSFRKRPLELSSFQF